MNFDEIKFMSLGSNCANLGFIKNRIKGPVDNLSGCRNIVCFEVLFDGDSIIEELNSDPIITDRTPNFEGDSDKYYSYKHYIVCHNDPRTEKYKIEFEKRLRTFQEFIKSINNPDQYLIYSLGTAEINKYKHTLQSDNPIQAEIDFLKNKGLLNKTIFVGCKNVNIKNNWDFYSEDFSKKFSNINYILIEDLNIWKPMESQKQFEEKFLKLNLI